MSSFRLCLFRGLVAVAAGLMIASFIMPWWTAHIPMLTALPHDAMRIYGYGLRHSLIQYASYLAADETPFYQTVLAWIYLAASVGLILYSTWLKGRKGRWLLGSIGLIYVAYAAIGVIWVASRTGDYGVSLQGWSVIRGARGMNIDVYASLQLGYYLAHAAGLTCITLALLRNKIIGRPKLGG